MVKANNHGGQRAGLVKWSEWERNEKGHGQNPRAGQGEDQAFVKWCAETPRETRI